MKSSPVEKKSRRSKHLAEKLTPETAIPALKKGTSKIGNDGCNPFMVSMPTYRYEVSGSARAPAITASLSCVRIVGTSGDVGYVGTKHVFAPALRGRPLTRFLCEWSSYCSRVKDSFCPNPNRAPRMDAAERGKSGWDDGLQIFDLIRSPSEHEHCHPAIRKVCSYSIPWSTVTRTSNSSSANDSSTPFFFPDHPISCTVRHS